MEGPTICLYTLWTQKANENYGLTKHSSEQIWKPILNFPRIIRQLLCADLVPVSTKLLPSHPLDCVHAFMHVHYLHGTLGSLVDDFSNKLFQIMY